jgi:hypothetical protein
MPNHVVNYIRFEGDANKIIELKNAIKNDRFGVGTIDFDKLIPMPADLHIEASTRTKRAEEAYKKFVDQYNSAPISLEDETEYLKTQSEEVREHWSLGSAAYHNRLLYGHPTWYEWANHNWNTKWNAYGYEEGVDYSVCEDIWFQTAWDAPYPIIVKLSKMYPDIKVIHEWANEDYGSSCGRVEYLNGEVVNAYEPEAEDEIEDFYAELWGRNDF